MTERELANIQSAYDQGYAEGRRAAYWRLALHSLALSMSLAALIIALFK